MSRPSPLSPTHIKNTIETITRLHEEHYQNASIFQKFVNRATVGLGRPCFILGLTVLIVCWIVLNTYLPFDPPPFGGLSLAVSLVSFYIVILILVAQKRDDELALHREQFILEVLIANEQKTTKVIQLLEEFRKDDPLVSNRADIEAEAMANPADPSTVMNTIRDIHAR